LALELRQARAVQPAARCSRKIYIVLTVKPKQLEGTMTAATITSKGRVTIPVDVREQLGLKSGDRIEFSFNEKTGRYEVYPVTRSLASLKGIVKKSANPVSIEDMNRAVAQ
jgi:AbrB family looped-hinge helix DNA binding protein